MRGSRVILIVILVLGLWLRWQLNGTWRLGPDEALYSTWARNIASGADPWLAHTPGVDKPPLLMYAIALAMNVYGYVEFASRFPSIIASAVSVLLTYLLARRLYKRVETALLAALLISLSPFAILYAPTAYADPIMVMWLLLAAVLAAHDHWAWAGAAAALAVLTKQEAPLLLPIVALMGALSTDAGTEGANARTRAVARRLISLTVAFAVVAGGIEWLWEAQRPGQASPFGLGLAHYGGIGLVGAGDVWPRLVGWWGEALRWVFASPVLNVAMIVAVAALTVRTVRIMRESGAGHDEEKRNSPAIRLFRDFVKRGTEGPLLSRLRQNLRLGAGLQPSTRRLPGPGWRKWLPNLLVNLHDARPTVGERDAANADLVLLLAIVYAVLARTVVSFQMWNRYLLLAVPLLCLALARVIDEGWQAALHRPSPRPSPRRGEGAGITLPESEAGAVSAGLPLPLPLRERAGVRVDSLLHVAARIADSIAPLLLVGVLLVAPVGDALAGRIPVGSDHGLYWGIDETALYVRENVPPGSVLYHQSLGWQLGYYLYGVHLDFWWYPSLDWLAQTAAARAEQSQYVIVPSWERSQDMAAALAAQGLVLLPVHSAHRPDGSVSFETYRIAPGG